jgi:hypothetical protein
MCGEGFFILGQTQFAPHELGMHHTMHKDRQAGRTENLFLAIFLI